MSDENAGEPSGQTPPPPGGQYPPNWGNAYPPPPQYGQPQYPPPGYGPPPPGYGHPYQPGQPPPPKHSQATTAMVFGIVSLAGAFACVLPILLAPVAWIMGAKAIKEIDANPGAYSGRSEANAGKILGIIGTCLLILFIVGITILIIVGVNGGFDEGYDSDYDYDFIGEIV